MNRWISLTSFLIAGFLLLTSLAYALPRTDSPHSGRDNNPPVILVGVAGLRWSDLNTSLENNPKLKEIWNSTLLGKGSLGNNVVRSVRTSACPVDGWLTLSSGARAGDLTPEASGECRPMTPPEGDELLIPQWPRYVSAARMQGFSSKPGAFGNALKTGGIKSLAIGPGASIALSDQLGVVVGDYISLPSNDIELRQEIEKALRAYDLTVIDAGSTPRPKAEPMKDQDASDALEKRTQAHQLAIDSLVSRIAVVLQQVPEEATLIVASVADTTRRPDLQFMAIRCADCQQGLSYSGSVRQSGLVQNADISVTVTTALGLKHPSGFFGSPITSQASSASQQDRLDALVNQEKRAQENRKAVPAFFIFLTVVNVGFFLFVCVVYLWGRKRQVPTNLSSFPWFIPISVLIASLPWAGQVVAYLPWWLSPAPIPTLLIAIILLAGISGMGTLKVSASIEKKTGIQLPELVPGLVSGLLFFTIVIDALRSGTAQLDAPMGVSSLVGGRFYGLNNTAFALLATSGIIFTACVLLLLRRTNLERKRLLQTLLIVLIGGLSVIVDGFPSFGADFGGPPALIPGFIAMGLVANELRVTWLRVLSIGVLTVGGVSALAFADWLRPSLERTHLGRFVDTVFQGEVWAVLMRKAQQNLHNLTHSYLTIVALAGLLVAFLVLRPAFKQVRGSVFSPTLEACVWALLITHLLGYALNDSGILITACGIMFAIPLGLAFASKARTGAGYKTLIE
ncbi:MAG: hypothetical protein Q4G30_07660 [Actinomycetaceae bacterium]|nr:hypothetical protein [Actinomycetaceae bacterium]